MLLRALVVGAFATVGLLSDCSDLSAPTLVFISAAYAQDVSNVKQCTGCPQREPVRQAASDEIKKILKTQILLFVTTQKA